MAANLARKLIAAHRVGGAAAEPEAGQEVALRIDQTLTQDATGTLVMLELEALGFSQPGEAVSLVREKDLSLDGDIAVNTSGGMLSESYMQSWNHQPELVRQLRGGLGNRQVQGAEVGQYVHDVAGKCKSLIYTRGA